MSKAEQKRSPIERGTFIAGPSFLGGRFYLFHQRRRAGEGWEIIGPKKDVTDQVKPLIDAAYQLGVEAERDAATSGSTESPTGGTPVAE